MRCVNVTMGGEFKVERCDDDVNYTLWPLFFVHILNEHNDQILETILSSLQVDSAPPLSFMVCGFPFHFFFYNRLGTSIILRKKGKEPDF